LPCISDAFALERRLSFRIIEALVPRIGNRVPIGIASKEIEGIIAVELTDGQASGWTFKNAIHDLPTIPGVSMTFVNRTVADNGGTIYPAGCRFHCGQGSRDS